MKNLNPSVQLLSKPENPDAISLVAAAARLCYRPATIDKLLKESIPRKQQERLFLQVVRSGHWSCLRHAVFVFGVQGVSRSFSHQLVRHVVGHSYEQQSQHFITEKAGLDSFHSVALKTARHRKSIGDMDAVERVYHATVDQCKDSYDRLVELGVPNHEARQVLPNAAETRLIWTANLEAILNMVRARACEVNTQEILTVAKQTRAIIAGEVPLIEPWLGPRCFSEGICPEGGKRFVRDCRRPWRNVGVLRTPEFPTETVYITANGWWRKSLVDPDRNLGEPTDQQPHETLPDQHG